MKIMFNTSRKLAPEKVGEAVRMLYEYINSLGEGKVDIKGMSLYVTLRDEDGDVVSLQDGDSEIWWEVRDEPRHKEGSERYLVDSIDGVYIYRHFGN